MIEPKIVNFESKEVLCVRKMGDYMVSAGEAFERYLNRDPRRTKPENLKTEIYIPIKE